MAGSERSSSAAVRNPIAADPEVARVVGELASAHPAAARALRATLRHLAKKWQREAGEAWASHKAPIASYRFNNAAAARHCAVMLKSSAVNAGHLARSIPEVRQARPVVLPLVPADFSPSTAKIREVRVGAGLTQTEAGLLVHASMRGWQEWEHGARVMRTATWELFLIKLWQREQAKQ